MRSEPSGPPIESTCSPAIAIAISIAASSTLGTPRDQIRPDPGIPFGLASRIRRVLSGTPPRVLLSRDYTHDGHFRPSSAARTDVLGDTVSAVRHLE